MIEYKIVKIKSKLQIDAPSEEYLFENGMQSISSYNRKGSTIIEMIFNDIGDKKIVQMLQKASNNKEKFSISKLQTKDWVLESQKSLKPINIEFINIHNSFYKRKYYSKVDIHINEGLAFGTGHHETTVGCIRSLISLSKKKRLKQVLDLGCGSAILSIVSSKLWKSECISVDNDIKSIKVAENNIKINEVSSAIKTINIDVLSNFYKIPNREYDLIVINIYANTINHLRFKLKEILKRKKFIILSGFTISQERMVLSNYRALGFIRVNRLIQNGWVTLTLERNF